MNQELVQLAFGKRALDQSMTLSQAIELLWQRNLIATGELAEQALVKRSRGLLEQNTRNKKASDFSDGSEHKYATVAEHSPGVRRAQITGLKNKTGLIRIMFYDPLTQRNYYFKINSHDLDGQVSPKVYFNSDGTPRTPTRIDKKLNLWDYECSVKDWAGDK